MVWLRLIAILLVPLLYVSGAMLVGLLLGSKAMTSRPMTPEQSAHFDEAWDYRVRHSYRGIEKVPVFTTLLDAGPAEAKFDTTEDFLIQVAEPACRNQRISFPEGKRQADTYPAHDCLRTANDLHREARWTLGFTLARMCQLRGAFHSWMDASSDGKSFDLWIPEACLEVAADKALWKGYFHLKDACRKDIQPSSSALTEREESKARVCVFRNLDDWVKQGWATQSSEK